MKNFKIHYLILTILIFAFAYSCSAKQSTKQSFTLKVSSLQTGIPLNGGSYVRAISANSDTIVKLDATDSAVFVHGIWEFQTVSFEGPLANEGKRYCGRINNLTLDSAAQDVSLTISEQNCLVEPFISLIIKLDTIPPNASALPFNDGKSEWTTSKTPIFTWNAATDIGSGVSHYEIALGTTPGGTDVESWMSVGNVTSYQFTGLSLTRGQAYYASIRGTDNNNNRSAEVLGDGWFVTNEMWTTNGTVSTMAQSGTTLYLGGSFTSVSEWLGGGIPLDRSTGLSNWSNPANKSRVSGTVFASVSDGTGGFYIGGRFIAVGGILRNNLAHILPDGSVDLTWNPNPNFEVLTMVINGSSIYVGGYFTSVGGQSRNYIAELDRVTGAPTTWNPNAGSVVKTIAVSGDGYTIYAGGFFVTIGASARNRIAAIDSTTGIVTAWNPNASGVVSTMVLNGSTLYVGGQFMTIGGQTRNYIAALDTVTGIPTSWNPNASNEVITLALSGSTIYAGGSFTTIGGGARNYIAALDITTGLATSWNPNSNATVITIAISEVENTIYVGGYFISIGGGARNYMASLDTATGVATSWNPNASSVVNVLALSSDGSSIYAGGGFSSIGGQTIRNRLAAFDIATGNLKPWNPNADGTVRTMATSGTTVYVGGQFMSISGQSRNYLAELDGVTGLATAFNPNVNNTVNVITSNGSTIYVGGTFTSIAGQTRNGIAAMDLATGIVSNWNPNANSEVKAIRLSGDQSTVYVGGYFTTIGGQSRNFIAALDSTTGLATIWNPNATTNYVNAIDLSGDGNTVYVGGGFANIGGQNRNYIAALDSTTGLATSWNPNANSIVHKILVIENTIYVGGQFTIIGGQARNSIVSLDNTGGLATSWNPNAANNYFYTILVNGNTVYAGGGSTGTAGGSGFFTPIDLTTGKWLPGF